MERFFLFVCVLNFFILFSTHNHQTGLSDISYGSPYIRDSNHIKKIFLNVPVSRKTGLKVFDETLMRSEWNFLGKLQKISKNQKKNWKNSENFFWFCFLLFYYQNWFSICLIYYDCQIVEYSFFFSDLLITQFGVVMQLSFFYFVQKISDFIFLMRTMLPRKKMLKRSSNSGWGKPKREKWNFDESNVFENQEVVKILEYC